LALTQTKVKTNYYDEIVFTAKAVNSLIEGILNNIGIAEYENKSSHIQYINSYQYY